MSLRNRLNDMGIDGLMCEELIREYLELTRIDPSVEMWAFLQTVKDSIK